MPSDFERALAVAPRPVPTLRPLIPFLLTPQSTCPHCGRIKRGSVLCCLVCHQSGQDHRRDMMPGKIELDPETGLPPRPEYAKVDRPVYVPTHGPKQGRKLTRKQRRAAMTAARNQADKA